MKNKFKKNKNKGIDQENWRKILREQKDYKNCKAELTKLIGK